MTMEETLKRIEREEEEESYEPDYLTPFEVFKECFEWIAAGLIVGIVCMVIYFSFFKDHEPDTTNHSTITIMHEGQYKTIDVDEALYHY